MRMRRVYASETAEMAMRKLWKIVKSSLWPRARVWMLPSDLIDRDWRVEGALNLTLKPVYVLEVIYDPRPDPMLALIGKVLWLAQTSSYVPKIIAEVRIMVVAGKRKECLKG